MFPIILRYFCFLAAAVGAANLVLAGRRLRTAPMALDAARASLARRVLWAVHGGSAVMLLVTGIVQHAAGYADPFFAFYDPHSPASVAVWSMAYVSWAATLVGLWRPGVAEVAVELALYRGPRVSPTTFRIVFTALTIVNATVFGALLAGLWGPIARPGW